MGGRHREVSVLDAALHPAGLGGDRVPRNRRKKIPAAAREQDGGSARGPATARALWGCRSKLGPLPGWQVLFPARRLGRRGEEPHRRSAARSEAPNRPHRSEPGGRAHNLVVRFVGGDNLLASWGCGTYCEVTVLFSPKGKSLASFGAHEVSPNGAFAVAFDAFDAPGHVTDRADVIDMHTGNRVSSSEGVRHLEHVRCTVGA